MVLLPLMRVIGRRNVGKEILIRVRFVLYLEPLTQVKCLISLFSLSGTSLANFAGF